MIEQKTIEKICSEYGVGDYISIEKVLEGKLNDNYILNTTTGKYFIKSVGEKSKDKLKTIYGVESLMKSRGIPAISMLTTKTEDIFVLSDGEVYTLYPFIENLKKATYSEDEYYSLGEMLGKIHIIGKENTPDSLKLKQFNRPNDEVIIGKLKKYKENIENKADQNDVDKLFLEYIEFKLKIVPKIKKITLVNNCLIHGDYHPGNVLMNEKSEIVGVIDWEKSEFAPQAYELARSFLYTCYFDGYDIESVYKFSQFFLKGYFSLFPINIKEIMDGFSMRVHRTALSSWIEDSYYLRNDTRSLDLIKHEMHLLDLVVNDNFLEKIEGMLETMNK